MQRRSHPDPVTPEVRERVIQRDLAQWKIDQKVIEERRQGVPTKTGCVATILDPSRSGPCLGPLTLDHVKDQPMMGKRAPSDEFHLVTICLYHHIESGWATAHRPGLRWYLKKVYATND